MANWSLPQNDTSYLNVLSNIHDKCFDAISLGYGAITNPVQGMIKYVRASNKFQEYDGAVWQDKVLAIAGGGTGATTLAGLKAALGFGTMADQNFDAVDITNGHIHGLSEFSVACKLWTSSNVADSIKTAGGITAGTPSVAIIDANGKIPAISAAYFANLSGANLTGIPTLSANNVWTGDNSFTGAKYFRIQNSGSCVSGSGIEIYFQGGVAQFACWNRDTNTGYPCYIYATEIRASGVGNHFVGNLTGNVTGDCSGSSGSCTGNAATSSACSGNAATATNVTWGGVTGKPAPFPNGTYGMNSDPMLPITAITIQDGIITNITDSV